MKTYIQLLILTATAIVFGTAGFVVQRELSLRIAREQAALFDTQVAFEYAKTICQNGLKSFSIELNPRKLVAECE